MFGSKNFPKEISTDELITYTNIQLITFLKENGSHISPGTGNSAILIILERLNDTINKNH